MKNYYQFSGLNTGLDFLINKNWSPEQALAVFELLDDLRERIFNHYQIPIQEQLKQQRVTTGELEQGLQIDDMDF